MPLPNISPELLKAYQEEIAKRSSSATLKRKAVSLSKFFSWAQDQGHIEENPITGLELINIPTNDTKSNKRSRKPIFALVSLTLGIIAIILALRSIKFPIPSKKSSAQNETITQITPEVQTPQILSASPWTIFAKLSLSDSSGSPITTSQTITFKLYKNSEDTTPIWTSSPTQQTPDVDGNISMSLDGVPSDVFFKNDRLFLGGTAQDTNGNSQTLPSMPVSTANTASNLQGFYPASAEEGATAGTIPVISNDGSLILASESPSIKAKDGNLLVEGQAVTIKAVDGSGGNIEINPDANGYAHFLFEGNKGNFLNAQAPNLTSGSLYYGMVPNNATDYYLINLQNGSNLTTKFSVDAQGDAYIAGDTTIVGDLGTNNLSVNNITASGNITDIKKGTALSDLVTLTLDETNKPIDRNSIYSTLVLKRYDGAREAAALYVDEGNAIFDGQVQLGRYTTNPTAIGKGSLVFNTGDNKVYVWDGSTWNAVGSGSGSSAFSDITSGTNTIADMLVGSGATLGYTGTGTIDASSLIGATWAAPGTIGSGTPNTGVFTTLSSTSGTNLATVTGNVGIGTTGPDAQLDSSATTEQLRLTYTDGSVYSSFTTDSSGNLTIDNTGTKTVIADDLQINGADILDTNGNEFLRFSPTASAVNELTIANAATGGTVTLAATGGDADIAFSIDAKGADALNLNGTGTGDILIGGGSGGTGCTITNATGNLACTGDITGANLSGTNTGDQLTFKTIDAPAGTDPVADTTTDTLTFLAGSNVTITGDAAADSITIAATDTTGSWTLAGDSGDNQTISNTDTASILGGVNGIDTVGSATDTLTINLDTTEIGTTTFGTGAAITWTFDVGATDPTIAFTSDLVTITAATTSLSGDLKLTGADILDTNGNEFLRFSPTASAVNELTIANAATGGTVTLAATGGDADIAFSIDAKGADALNLNGTGTGDILIGGGSGGTGCTITNATGNLACTGDITGANLSGTNTGDQLTFKTIDAPAGTDPVADTTTDTLTFLAGSNVTITGDAAADSITIAATDTTGSWTLAGDSGDNQTISNTDTASILGGVNGIDTVGSATDTLTINLDTTEIGTTTFGTGAAITWTFDAGATDPTIAFTSDLVTITAATTSLSGDLKLTGADILDTNGNEFLRFSPTASAVNELTIANAATGGTVTLAATGGDADIAFSIDAKGADALNLNGTGTGDILIGGGSGGTGCTITNATGNLACTGDITGANLSGTNTGDQLTFKTIDAPAGTDPVADTTTDTLTFLAGSNVTITGDAAADSITIAATDTTGSWTLAGDSGDNQTISNTDTASILGGVNGIDTVGSATDTLTINLDTTEIGTTTFGTGAAITWTFDAGATDPTIAFTSDLVTITAATTSLSGDLKLTGADILDTNGNEFLRFSPTASAVNELTIANAATGGTVTLAATGGDADIAFSIDAKGADALNLNGTGTGDILIGGGSGGTGCTITNATGNLACTGDITGANLSGTNTGDQLTFKTIDAPAGTDPVADTTTDTLTFLAGSNVTITGDAAADSITIAATDTTGSWTLAGDSGDNQTISNTDTASILGGVNGIDTVGSATDTLTINLDTTEIGTTTFGTGAAITWTFDVGATDPTIAFTSDLVTITAATTSLSGDLKLTGADILDTNGNEFLRFSPTASAVDELTIANAATGGTVTLAATGGDADIAFSIDAKGADALNLNGTGTGDILIGGGSGGTGCTITNATGNLACTGDITGANLSGTNTGDQLTFKTIDAPAGTDPVADTTTDTLTFLAGSNVTITGDAAADSITIAATDTTGSWTLAGDSGDNQTISNTDTASILGGVNGIDTVGSATDTLTINLDTTEIGTTTFGTGAAITWTFDAGATDPTIAFTSDLLTITAATTSLSGDLKLTGADILDTNGNEFLRFSPTASAVDELTIANAATGGTVTLAATGGDADIAFSIDAKGADALNLNGTGTGDILIGGGSGGTGCTITNATGNLACTGDITGANLSGTNTGDQLTFKTIDAPAGTDPVADTTTDTLTFLAGSNVTITGDAAADSITIAATDTTGSWTLAGDSGDNQTISNTDTASILGGVNGIDTVGSATDTLTINLDTTEIGTTTFGTGAAITWTFDAGATDPTIAFTSDLVTITAATTSLSGDLKLTGADILDTNGNEFLRFSPTASAVNELTIANAATGGTVTLAATGGDADIAFSIDAKGADALNLNGTGTGDILIGGGSGGTGCTITNATGNLACTGDITGANLSGTNTGDQLTFKTIDAPAGTDPVADTTTDTLTFLAGSNVTITGDAAADSITIAATDTTGSWTLAGDSGDNQTISNTDTASILGGVNGIDTVGSATDTLTINLDTTEIGTTTFGTGAAITWTFDVGATDPTIAFTSDLVTITAATTSLSGDLKLTGADILDTNGNEFLRFSPTASAVNELTIANAATGGTVTLAATGGDADIAFSIDAKGADALNLNGTGTGDILIGGGSGGTGCTITNATGNLACTGDITGANLSGTNTGDQLTFKTIDAPAGTDPVADTTTDTLTFLAGSNVTITGDAAADSITIAATDTTGSWTLAGDSGDNQTISNTDTASILGGVNGIDTVGSATDTLTINLDTTEIGTTTFGTGAAITWTFDVGATDPTIAFTSDLVTITAATTSLSGDLKLTGADILDTNGNEFLRFSPTASAVNELTIANAATGGTVTLAATGGDADIAFSIDAKGADALNLNGTGTGDILIGGGSGGTGCTITNATGNLACTGDITGANLSGTNTGDQLTFKTIDAPAGTDPVADTTTDTLTFLAGSNVTITGDAAADSITIAATDTTGSWTLAGDSGDNQTISNTDTASILGGVNGIDTVGSATDTLTINLDTTEIGTTTFGTGAAITWTFDVGATDPTIAFTSDLVTITAATTSLSGDLKLTGADILDTNGNEFLRFSPTASAVDELTIANAATGGTVTLAATGGDADIAFSIDAKGADALNLNGTGTGDILIGGGSGGTGCTITNATGNLACTGDITGANLSGTNTGDQLTFKTIDAPAGTDPVADTTTDTLTFLAGSNVTITGDAAADSITIAATDTTGSWTLAGDSGDNQTISNTDTASILGGVNGIDTVGSATDTLTINLDTTEIGTTTFGTGAAITWTFDAGATDPTIAFTSDLLTITAATTSLSGDLKLTGADILDTNGNEFLRFSPTASAVNELTIANAATGGTVTLAATGGDADIAFSIDAKGADALNLNGTGTGDILIGGGSGGTGCTITNATGNLACTGDITGANLSGTNTGDQLTFKTIDAPAGTDPVADTTTDTLTFLAGSNVTITGDAAADSITIAATDTTGSWTLAGDSGDNQTISNTDTASILGGVNGIDTVGSATDTLTINLDTTEIGTTTFGTGAAITWTFDAGATDPTIAFTSDLLTITAATTSLSGDLKLTGADILDTNGNEFLRFSPTASAVNELTIANAATGGTVTLAATGGDADIAFSIDAKGADALNLNGTGTGDILIGGGSGGTGCTITNATGNLACTGDITGANLSGTNTGDQLTFKTIDAPAGTDPVADTTTDTLTFLAGSNVTITGDAAADSITIAATDTTGSWTLAGDSGDNQTISNTDTASILGGVNGIDTVGSATDTLTINLDTTEIGTTTFGTGAAITWTFDAGATDPTIAFTSDLLTITAATTSLSGDLKLTGADILDTNGNEFLRFSPTASAVDELTIANAATGGTVTLAATGGDADIAFSIDAKGADALNLNGTGTGDILIGGGSGGTGCTVTNSNGNLTCSGTISGTIIASSMKWNALTTPDGALTLAHGVNTTTMGWTPTGALDAWTTNLVNNGGSATTQNAVVINNAAAGSFTDVNTESLLLVQQLDTTVAGTTVVDNGIKIDSAANSGITNGLTITNSAGNLTTGINIADTAGGTLTTGIAISGTVTNAMDAGAFPIVNIGNAGTDFNSNGGLTLAENLVIQGTTGLTFNTGAGGDITFANAEKIDNDTDGTITITAPTTSLSGILTVNGTSGTGIDITNTGITTDIIFQNNETIDNNTDGTILLTAAITSLSGDLTITGNDITFGNGETISNATDSLLNLTSPTVRATASTAVDIDSPSINLATQATDIELIDNTASALTISEGANNYFLITTTNTTPIVTLDTLENGGVMNFGIGNYTRAINIGTGTGVDTIHIGDGATGADVITMGSANAGNVTVQSNAALTLHGEASSIIDFPNFDVDTAGNTIIANQGDLRLNEGTGGGTNYVGFQAPATLAADNLYTLPDAFPGGAAGYFLTSDDTGVMSWSNSVGGGSPKWNALTDPDGTLTLAHGTNPTIMGWTPTGALDAFTMNLVNNGGSATTQNALIINNAVAGSFTDTATESLLLVQQLDTTAAGTTVVTNGIKIDSAASSDMTNGLTITNSGGDLTTGINIADTAGGTLTTGIVISGTVTNAMDAGAFPIINIGNAGTDFNSNGGLTLAENLAVNGDNITADGTALTININGASAGQLTLTDTDTLNVGGKTGLAYNAFANAADSPTAATITADNDLFIGGDLELKGGLYLTGRNIYNTVGGVSTPAITFPADPTAVDSFNTLSYGSWLVKNSTNDGIATLMVDQESTVADIFTASSGGTPKFVITNAGNVGIGTITPSTKLQIDGTIATDLPTYGSEFLSSAGWTSVDWTGSWAGGWTHTTGNTTVLSQSTAAVNATKYKITFTVTGVTAGYFETGFGGQTDYFRDATGTWILATTSTANLTITPTSDFDGTVVISIKEIIAPSSPLAVFADSTGTSRMEIRANTEDNTFLGVGAGSYNVTGSANTAVGDQSLYNNITGFFNTASGYRSLYSNTTGSYNSAFGIWALRSNTTGTNNVAVGDGALYYNTEGNKNTAIGDGALNFNTTGVSNSALGYDAGNYIADFSTANETSFNSLYLGSYTKALADGDFNEIVIGYDATGFGSNTAVLGDGNIVTTILRGDIGIGDTSPASLLTVGSGDLFQVDSSGVIAQIEGVAHIIDDVGGDLTLTSASTYVSVANNLAVTGDIKLTGADILDTNGNEFLRFTSTASAVDEITIANAAANGTVTMAATGDDANIALSIDAKGTDALNLNGTGTGDILMAGGSASTGCTITNATGGLACSEYMTAQKFIDTSSSTYYLDPGGATSLYIAGNITSDSATFSINSTADQDITLNAGAGTVFIGNGTGKLNAGTVDPPYTIDGEKYATYMTSMTGVKEETTGTVSTSEYISGLGYRSVIDFTQSLTGSDLWLFSQVTNLKENFDKLVVLLSPSADTKSWYNLDQSGKLSIFTSRPTSVSYRLTAPRFDSAKWANTRDGEGSGFVISNSNDWSEVNLNLSNSGDIQFNNLAIEVATDSSSPQNKYNLSDTSSSQIIQEVAAYSEALVANLRSGLIAAKEIAADSFYSFQGTIDNLLITNGLVSPIVQTDLISPLADKTDVVVKVGKVNEDGTSGFGELIVKDATGLEVASISSRGDATFSGQVTVDSVQANSATVSGELYAQKLTSPDLDNIQELLRQVKADQDLLAQASTWNTNTATDSAQIINSLQTTSLYVTDQAAVNSLSVSNSLSIGADLVIQGSGINTLTSPLSLQSLAMAPIEIMAGKIRIETNGDVTVNANLFVAGKIESPEAEFTKLTTQNIIIANPEATESAVINGNQINSNAMIGTATIPGGISEIVINNVNISDTTLIYVTPTSETLNNVLYIKSKEIGKFVVGFTNPIDINVSFNWWVVQVQP